MAAHAPEDRRDRRCGASPYLRVAPPDNEPPRSPPAARTDRACHEKLRRREAAPRQSAVDPSGCGPAPRERPHRRRHRYGHRGVRREAASERGEPLLPPEAAASVIEPVDLGGLPQRTSPPLLRAPPEWPHSLR